MTRATFGPTRRLVSLATGLFAVFACPVVQAQSSSAGGDSYVVRAKSIYTATSAQPAPLSPGILVVRNGKITAAGNEVTIPADLPVIDLGDEVICPGFVNAGSAMVAPHAGPHSLGAGYAAIDSYDKYSDYETALSSGVTTAHLSPGGHRLITGRGAVVRLAGDSAGRVLRPESDLSINFGVYDPPRLIKPPFFASSDVAIVPAQRQGPESRLGQVLEIEQLIARSSGAAPSFGRDFEFHERAFGKVWGSDLPLRIQSRRAADIEDAIQFAQRYKKKAYLVGAVEGDQLADAIARANLPVVLRLEQRYRGPDAPIGADPEALDAQIRVAGRLASSKNRVKIALAGAEGDSLSDLRMIGALAMRGGMSGDQALAAITRIPAEILGIETRVGSLAAGREADFLVLSAPPLSADAEIRRVYVAGKLAYDAAQPGGSDQPRAVVIKGGTVWVGNGSTIQNGSILLENGKIRAIGQRVARPPGARVIDAGASAFLVPGFIDAHGHLGLEEIGAPEQARTAATPDISLAALIGTASREFVRVARSGVTTVMLAAYRSGPGGSRVAAIKTFGRARPDLVTRETAGVKFSLSGADPVLGVNAIRDALEAGKKYEEAWKKYAEELEKWKKEKESGTATSKPKEEGDTKVEADKPDPITGTWEFTLSGGPMPEPVKATMKLKLSGNKIDGRATSPQGMGDEVPLTGTLDGENVTLEIDQDTGIGKPTIKAKLDREDHMGGQLKLGEMFSLEFEASRTDKSAVEFKVERSRKRGKDGRPQPPAVDERLEPIRPLLAGKVPALIEARTAAEARAAMKLLVDQYKVPVVLLDAPEAASIASEILSRKEHVGVVVPPEIVRSKGVRDPGMRDLATTELERDNSTTYNQAADLARLGIRVALQSDAEDGARALPLMGLFAVQAGLGGDEALRALTIDAARMYRIDDRLGTLEPGKDADVLIFSGHPFDAGSRLERVFVGGREVPNE